MSDEKNEAPLSAGQLWQALADLDNKIDRVAGLGAQTVGHIKRWAADQRLGDSERQQLRMILPEILRVMKQLGEGRTAMFSRMTAEDIAAAFDKPRIDEARRILKAAEDSGRTLVPRRKDDSITLRVNIPVGNKKDRKKLIVTAIKALAAAAAGAIVHHVIGK